MRNLKKFLALVMAMVMAFSLMVSVSAAEYKPSTNFSDADGITEAFVEAVDVLAGMKVYKGDDTGTLRPGSTITRAEVAALIYRLATGDVDDVRAGLYANYGNFADVNENDWFAGYVGYCANAGFIKGHGGYFNPYDAVTGYETLAMILRVIGYDKNHEFEGIAWQTNVSALGTTLGCLDDVKTTDYANTLHLASRRDVVASILFRAAAYVPTVNYTALSGYDKWTNLVSGVLNPTLGYKMFGLTCANGIVTGNQGTGLTNTRINFSRKGEPGAPVDGMVDVPDKPQYVNSATANKNEYVNNFKYESGLDLFGHKVKVWFNDTESTKTTYALYDNVVKTKVVAIEEDGDTYAGTLSGDTDNVLGVMASDPRVGFTLQSDGAFFSASFKPFGDLATSKSTVAGGKAGNEFTTDNYLYLLISNTTGNQLDAVVALNIENTKISQVDNVGVNKDLYVPTLDDDESANRHVTDNTTIGQGIAASGSMPDRIEIQQTALTSDSTKTLGDLVMGVAIGTHGERADNEIIKYNLAKITSTKVGAVVAYDTAAYAGNTDLNWNPDTVTLSDGTVLKKSPLYYTVVDNTIPQQADSDGDKVADNAGDALDQDVYTSDSYRFYLDINGEYIGAEPVYSEEFIFGTYTDYATALGSSTYEYTMVGVNMDGEQMVRRVNSLNGGAIPTQSNLRAPWRDQGNVNGQSGVSSGAYTGYTINEGGALTTRINRISPAMTQDSALAGADQAFTSANSKTDASGVTINSTSIAVGAQVTQNDNLYLTENTKFIVVSGAGTDTQKVEVYNGISELKGNASSVAIYGGYEGDVVSAGNRDAGADPVLDVDVARNTMMYYSTSLFTYAQNNLRNRQIDTLFLPKDAITWNGVSELYFVGNGTECLKDPVIGGIEKHPMYVNGERGYYWIDMNSSDTTGGTLRNNSFFLLADSGSKGTDGDPIYVATYANDVADYLGTGIGQYPFIENRTGSALYKATTKNSQNASFAVGAGVTLYNVANAKVVNLNPAYPGIVDLATLNEASSLDANGGIAVSPVLKSTTGAGSHEMVIIYVNYAP